VTTAIARLPLGIDVTLMPGLKSLRVRPAREGTSPGGLIVGAVEVVKMAVSAALQGEWRRSSSTSRRNSSMPSLAIKI